jgi:hypothetical protein
LVIFDWDTIRETIETFRPAAGAAGHDGDMLPIMLQVNGNVTAEPLDERGPLLGSTDQVAADLDQPPSSASSTSTGTLTTTRSASSRYWNGCVAADRSCGSQTPMHVADLDPIEAPAASKCRCSYRARGVPRRWQNLLIARQTLGERGRREER